MIKTIDFKTPGASWQICIEGNAVTLSRAGIKVWDSSQIVEEGNALGQKEKCDNGIEAEPDQKPQRRKRKKRLQPGKDLEGSS